MHKVKNYDPLVQDYILGAQGIVAAGRVIFLSR